MRASTAYRSKRRRRRGISGFERKLLRTVQPTIGIYENGFQTFATQGQCSYTVIAQTKVPSDLATFLASSSWNQLAPPGNYTGPVAAGHGTAATGYFNMASAWGPSCRIFLKTWTRVELINNHVAPVTLWFHWVVPRGHIKNIQLNSATAGATLTYNGLTDIANPTAASNSLVKTGFYDLDQKWLQSNGTANSLHTKPSLTLFDNRRFCQQFKILRVRKMCLNPGKCISLILKKKWHEFKFPTEDFIAGTSCYLAYRGCPLVILKQFGTAATDTVADTVSAGSSRISYLLQRKYYFKALKDNQKTVLDPLSSFSTLVNNETYLAQPLAGAVLASADVH